LSDTESLQTLVEELRKAHAQLRASHERFERIARTIPCVLYDFVSLPDGTSRFLYLSPRCREFFELEPQQIIERPNRFWKLLHPDDLAWLQVENAKSNSSRELFVAEARVRTPSGQEKWIRFSSLPNAPEAGQPTLWSGFMFDVTERKLMEEEVRRLATTDSLTGVANRRHFLQQLQAELDRFRRSGSIASLLMLDLDSFKRVNDVHGHATGDAVLRHFAGLVGGNLRQADSFGRLGGEEFGVLLPETRLAGAMELAARLCGIVAATPVLVDERPVHVTTSIGVTEFQSDETGPESAMARADAALYRAKQTGRNRVVVY
jgi:diguanylate cyclase (GGDEF)-like protein/PAS domain S-box-containing protein